MKLLLLFFLLFFCLQSYSQAKTDKVTDLYREVQYRDQARNIYIKEEVSQLKNFYYEPIFGMQIETVNGFFLPALRFFSLTFF